MSELIHTEDSGIMIPDKFRNILKCSKCGFKVQKKHIHLKYEQGILEIPI
ncbi:MAG: hypothetical protein ACXVZU_05785 [Methanobacteriaceae archaeon]